MRLGLTRRRAGARLLPLHDIDITDIVWCMAYKRAAATAAAVVTLASGAGFAIPETTKH